MSVGSNLQEMENVVTKGAAPADQIRSDASGVSTPGQAQVEDLGGPTPENYKVDDDSAKLRDPAKTVAQVKDVVNAKAVAAESTEEEEGEFVSEEETTEEEYVSEEETAEEEVVEEVE